MPNKMKKLTKKKNKRTISKICKDLNKKNPVMILNETPHGFRCKEIGTFSTPNKTVFGVAMTVSFSEMQNDTSIGCLNDHWLKYFLYDLLSTLF